MYTLNVKTHFDAAHYIRDYEGKCQREHGHRWEVEVCLQGEKLSPTNMLVDFSWVKKIMNKIIDGFLDHHQLNETLEEENVTAEFLAKWFYEMFDEVVGNTQAGKSAKLIRVRVWESPECCIEYNPDPGPIESILEKGMAG